MKKTFASYSWSMYLSLLSNLMNYFSVVQNLLNFVMTHKKPALSSEGLPWGSPFTLASKDPSSFALLDFKRSGAACSSVPQLNTSSSPKNQTGFLIQLILSTSMYTCVVTFPSKNIHFVSFTNQSKSVCIIDTHCIRPCILFVSWTSYVINLASFCNLHSMLGVTNAVSTYSVEWWIAIVWFPKWIRGFI